MLNITPFSTRQSEMSPPGSFSTLAYRLVSTSGGDPSGAPSGTCATVVTASRASSAISGPNRDVNFVPIHELRTLSIDARSATSTSKARRSTAARAVSMARVSPRMTTVACMLRSRKGSAAERSSPAV